MPTAQLPRAAYTTSTLVEVHWLPIQKRYIVKVLLITYKPVPCYWFWSIWIHKAYPQQLLVMLLIAFLTVKCLVNLNMVKPLWCEPPIKGGENLYWDNTDHSNKSNSLIFLWIKSQLRLKISTSSSIYTNSFGSFCCKLVDLSLDSIWVFNHCCAIYRNLGG